MRKAISTCGAVALLSCALATAGAAPAQASQTTLCRTANLTCTSPYAAHTVFKASGTMFIAAGTVEPTCTSTIEFETNSVSGTPLTAKVLSYTLTGCVDHGSSCSASTILGGPFEAEMEWVPSTFDVVPGGGGTSPQYKFTCSSINCQYTANPAHMFLQGGSPAELVAEFALAQTAGSPLCASGGGTAIELEFTSPTEVWLEHT